ncbi:MAG TPA: hypothetical protein VED41_13230, partial [Solirubrobacteraceae bacterium]|nr:hypothetical protein [Solirubrobacteraceae bacterium]
TYMSAVTEGEPCVEFPTPKETISYRPFYGQHTVTGEALAHQQFEGGAPSEQPAKHHPGHGKRHSERPAPEEQEIPKIESPPATQPETPQTAPAHEPATAPTPSSPAASPTTGGSAPP